jgi:L-2-hydroxyglutarate oxidase LhgO
LLYERCERQGVPHRKTGKFVLACEPGEVAALEALHERGRGNGAGALELVDAAGLRKREPRVRAEAALWSPETGIVDAHALMASYQAELESAGGAVVVRTRLVGLERAAAGWRAATLSADGERFAIEVPWVVNAADSRPTGSPSWPASTWTRSAGASTRARATTSPSRRAWDAWRPA